jgi:hypothetical protein
MLQKVMQHKSATQQQPDSSNAADFKKNFIQIENWH